jgi:uncharacterized protein
MRSAGSANFSGWLRKAAIGALALMGVAGTAEAQLFPFLFGERPSRQQQYQPRQPSYQQPSYQQPSYSPSQPVERQADYSRAPAPRKAEGTPTTKVVVMGDSMADWLAYGLEDAFGDAPEIGIVRKHRTYSGLLRYDSRNDTATWAQVAREVIAAEKPNFVVMMLGVNDRAAIRERPQAAGTPRRPGEPASGPELQASTDAEQSPAEGPPQADPPDDEQQPSTTAPEPPPPQRGGSGSAATIDFRSDRWSAAYGRRIEETIAVLKSANVPVIWVGLPALRGTRSTSEMTYLNGLYRAAAEKTSIVYADVWDGFVDESGKFSVSGPDLEGQNRRLRTADGVHFTRAGARKLAHFVEREIQRLMQNRAAVPVALPAPEAAPQQPAPGAARPAGPAARPLAGPVLPLTAAQAKSDELLGAANARPASADSIAAAVLVRGEPLAAIPGRADDFTWPRPAYVNFDTAPGATPTPAPPPAAAPAVAARSPSYSDEAPQRRSAPVARAPQAPGSRQSQSYAPRPPAPVGGGGGGGLFGPGGLFGIFR